MRGVDTSASQNFYTMPVPHPRLPYGEVVPTPYRIIYARTRRVQLARTSFSRVAVEGAETRLREWAPVTRRRRAEGRNRRRNKGGTGEGDLRR